MERPEGGSEGRSTAAGKRFSSKILLCPAVRLLGPSGQWRLLLQAAMWSEYQELYLESAINQLQIMSLPGQLGIVPDQK